MDKISLQSRARGMLVGLAVGDALGAPVEFGYNSRDIEALGDKIAHFQDSPLGEAGSWTDDTSMALCLADSLLECGGYNSYDIMKKYLLWATTEYRTCDGLPAADIGGQTREALQRFCDEPVVAADEEKEWSAGNGPIMRLAPIVIANTFSDADYDSKLENKDLWPLTNMAILSCRETHNSIAAECVTGYFATALYAAIRGFNKTDICSYAERGPYKENADYDRFWLDNVDSLVNRWRKKNDGSELRDLGGYIVDAYAIALWGFVNSDSFEDGMLKVLRLGGDTDTNGAIYGQLAGAYYGYEAIPEEWRKGVVLADELVEIADKLLAMPECPVIRTRFEDDEHFEDVPKK